MTISDSIRGVFPAVATPLDSQGNPDLAMMADHCRTLLGDQATGLAILGSTGEATSFSLAERQVVAEGLVQSGIPAERLLPGAGLCSMPETLALIRHGLSIGVTRFLLLPPFYYKNPSDDGLYAYFSRLVESVADDRLRIVLYHFPAMSGVPVPTALVGRLRAAFPGTFAGMKDSSADPAHSAAMIRDHPGFSVLVGADQTMLDLLGQGGAGCVTALSNLTAAEMVFLFSNHANPAAAAEVARVQRRIGALRTLSSAGVQTANIKALLARRYRNPAWLRLRPPFLAADDAVVRHLTEEADAIDRDLPFSLPVQA